MTKRVADFGVHMIRNPTGADLDAELVAAAMRFVAAYSNLEHLAMLTVLERTTAGHLFVSTILSAIRSSGVQRGILTRFKKEYLTEADDAASFATLYSATEELAKWRNMIAHGVWCSLLTRNDVVAIVDPEEVKLGIAIQRDVIAAALADPSRKPGLIPVPAGPAEKEAVAYERADFDALLTRTIYVTWGWETLHNILRGMGGADIIDKLRGLLRIQISRIPPPLAMPSAGA